MWYSDVVYIYICYVGNLMVWMDFFVMASELGCSKLFVVPCFLGGKKQSLKNRWTNWWFGHCYSSLLWNCHARYSVITEKTCGNLCGNSRGFGWTCLFWFWSWDASPCCSSLIEENMEASMEEEHSKKSERTMRIFHHLFHIFSSMVPSFPEQGGEHPNSKTRTNESIQNHENSWHV